MKTLLHLLFMFFITLSIISGQDITVVTENWSPYNYENNGVIVGISTEIVRETLKRAEIEADIRIYPWPRAYDMALNEKNVLIYTIYRNREREDKFKWIGPISMRSRHFFYKLTARTDIVLNTLEEAKEYTIGVLRDNYAHQKLIEEGFTESENLVVSRITENNIKMLMAGRIDLFPGDEIATAALIEKMELPPGIIEKSFLLFSEEAKAYMAFNRHTPDQLVVRVRNAFEEVKAEGIIESTTEKYLRTFE